MSMNSELSFDLSFPVVPGTCILGDIDVFGRLPVWSDAGNALVFVSQGSAIAIRAEGEIQLGPGRALVTGRRSLLGLQVSKDTEYYLLCFKPKTPDLPTGESMGVPTFTAVDRPERLTYLLRRYLLVQDQGGGSGHILCALLTLILRELVLSAPVKDADYGELKYVTSIASCVDIYIAAHFRENIGTPDIASELRYNSEYLERAYRQQRQISIRDAIHLRRLREAGAQLLLHKEWCISDIAEMCGYHDANYFQRDFKRAMKMTPNTFRDVHGPPGEVSDDREVANAPT